MSADDVHTLPPGLPVPEDDGACAHLVGEALPDLTLDSSLGPVNVREVDVLYVYPRAGRPGRPMAEGWDEIPGARGCTPETCAFRDHHEDLQKLGADVFGFSTQTTEYQKEMVERLHVPFEVLSVLWSRTSYLYYMIVVMPGIYIAVADLVARSRVRRELILGWAFTLLISAVPSLATARLRWLPSSTGARSASTVRCTGRIGSPSGPGWRCHPPGSNRCY